MLRLGIPAPPGVRRLGPGRARMSGPRRRPRPARARLGRGCPGRPGRRRCGTPRRRAPGPRHGCPTGPARRHGLAVPTCDRSAARRRRGAVQLALASGAARSATGTARAAGRLSLAANLGRLRRCSTCDLDAAAPGQQTQNRPRRRLARGDGPRHRQQHQPLHRPLQAAGPRRPASNPRAATAAPHPDRDRRPAGGGRCRCARRRGPVRGGRSFRPSPATAAGTSRCGRCG